MANRQFSFLGSYDGTSQRHHGYHFISEALPFARHANCARVPGQIRHVVSPLYRSSAQTGMVTRNPQAPTLSSSQHSLLHQMSPQQAYSRSHSDLLQHSANQMTPALRFVSPVSVRAAQRHWIPSKHLLGRSQRSTNPARQRRGCQEWHLQAG